MSTIYDIAGKTGFSASTVARALSGKGYCSQQARNTILKAAKEMNYAPVQAAKSLKNKQTKKVMLCIPDIFNPYYFAMIEGANKVLERYGYYTVLVHSEHDKEKELQLVAALGERFVDGLIMVSFDFYGKLVKALAGAPVPVVLTNQYPQRSIGQSFDCVYVDHTKATSIATRHLIEKGHRRIVFLGGNNREQTGKERLQGYTDALAEAGLARDEELVLQADFTRKGGEQVFSAFLTQRRPFTAVVACNDLMGMGCLNACQSAGLHVPRDVSLVSLDNTDYCHCTHPQLTSVDMRQYQIGSGTAELLMERIRKERDYAKLIKLDPTLVYRQSVASVK